jgi:Uncharacterized conserved protein (COG2071)
MTMGVAEPVTAESPPRPAVMPLGAAFSDVAFLHWDYEPAQVRPLLPAGTQPDTIGGAANVGLVGFRMRCYGEFLELNVRTYSVDRRGRRGVVFLSMEADRLPWVLAARVGGLPYNWARMSLDRNVHVLEYRSARRRPGPPGGRAGSDCGSAHSSPTRSGEVSVGGCGCCLRSEPGWGQHSRRHAAPTRQRDHHPGGAKIRAELRPSRGQFR